jgi:carboxypeptidase Taq
VAWLRAQVHARASLPLFDELVEEATGAPLSADAFLTHIAERYGVRLPVAEVA